MDFEVLRMWIDAELLEAETYSTEGVAVRNSVGDDHMDRERDAIAEDRCVLRRGTRDPRCGPSTAERGSAPWMRDNGGQASEVCGPRERRTG